MRIDQNKPKNLNPWINHWHSNHKASHFAVVVLFVNHHLECLHIYEERTSNWIFLSTWKIFSSVLRAKFVFILCLQMHPKMEIKKQRTQKWNVDDDKKIIHGILPHHSNDCRSFTFSLPFRFEVSMVCTNFIECSHRRWQDLISRQIFFLFFHVQKYFYCCRRGSFCVLISKSLEINLTSVTNNIK